jgi:hypothetical protein
MKSPDLVAGPLIGDGAPEDFLIDVFSPRGEQYVNPLAGAPETAAAFKKIVDDRGSFGLYDLDNDCEAFYGPINKKIAKYSDTRGGSPMVGLAMYFCITPGDSVGPLLAHMQVLIALDKAFGLTLKDGGEQMAAALDGAMLGDTSMTIIVHAFDVQLAFLMVHADIRRNKCL